MPSEPTPPDLTESMYPEVEALVETANAQSVESRFEDLKASLKGLKGARSEQGKKVKKALERAEELFLHLLEVRGKLSASTKKPKK
jgi:hypothetical protein